MLNLSALGKIKNEWNGFKYRHPKINDFLYCLKGKDIVEGQEIAIAIRYPDGSEVKTGIRLNKDDLEFLETVKNLTNSMM